MNNTVAVLHPKCASEYRVLSEFTHTNAEAYKLFRKDINQFTPSYAPFLLQRLQTC